MWCVEFFGNFGVGKNILNFSESGWWGRILSHSNFDSAPNGAYLATQDLYFAGKDRKRRMELIGRTLATLNPDVVGRYSRLQNFFDYGIVNSGLIS